METSCYADRQAVKACVVFSFCSASLLLLNKLIMHAMKDHAMPSFISTLQFAASAITALVLMVQDWVPRDPFEWRKVKPYIVYVSMFVTTIYCNFKALQYANVETLIVARSCVPCVVALLEFGCLGRTLPSPKSWLAMVVMVTGAVGYVKTDRQFEMDGIAAYTWVILYFVVISFEMALGKYIVGPQLGFASMWGPVLYTNALSMPPMMLIGLSTGEQGNLCQTVWTTSLLVLVLMSCVVGVAISFFGFRARSLVSATCFTVLGVANKMATVIVNTLMWDEHATAFGIASLFVCLLGAAAYQQSPMRPEQSGVLLPSTAPAAAPH